MIYKNGYIWKKDLNIPKNVAININHIHMMIIMIHQSGLRTARPEIFCFYFYSKHLYIRNCAIRLS